MTQEASEWKSVAWQQFLTARKELLDRYDQALVHAREEEVSTHHGIVGEAAVRDWLERFLPKRYGVTSGYIKSQDPRSPMTSHFDVIIYDQLESPVLWTEANKDKSEKGLKRVIPAEYVRAIIEVKSALNRTTLRAGLDKLRELQPLLAGLDAADERYPKFLPANTILSTLFFELRAKDSADPKILELVRDLDFPRLFYGPVILRGEGVNPDYTAIFTRLRCNEPINEIWPEKGLLFGCVLSSSKESPNGHIRSMLMWNDVSFSDFAFGLLALLNGKFRPGYVPSFYGLDFRGV